MKSIDKYKTKSAHHHVSYLFTVVQDEDGYTFSVDIMVVNWRECSCSERTV